MLDSMANIVEILDNIQDEAASNCNQSPVEVIVMILYYLSLQISNIIFHSHHLISTSSIISIK